MPRFVVPILGFVLVLGGVLCGQGLAQPVTVTSACLFTQGPKAGTFVHTAYPPGGFYCNDGSGSSGVVVAWPVQPPPPFPGQLSPPRQEFQMQLSPPRQDFGQGQIFGGPNSAFNNPGALLGPSSGSRGPNPSLEFEERPVTDPCRRYPALCR